MWEADLEACRLLIQSLQLQEARGSLRVEDEGQMGDLEGAAWAVTPTIPPSTHSEDERTTPLQAVQEWKAHHSRSPHCRGGEQKEVCPIGVAFTGRPALRGALGPCCTRKQHIWGRLFIKPYKLGKVLIAIEYDYKIK